MKSFTITALRMGLGFIFLWAFVDKTIGLGFATTSEKAWINGGSPTYGFLTHGTHGPFALFFQSLAGNALVDWLFMLGLLGVGLTLLLNYFTRIGAYVGIIMLALMYLAALPPENNPLIDDHLVYIVVLLLVAQQAPALGRQK